MRTKYWNLTKFDQHVTEMMITTGNNFKNFPASGLLIILQKTNSVAKRNINCVLIPALKTGILVIVVLIR